MALHAKGIGAGGFAVCLGRKAVSRLAPSLGGGRAAIVGLAAFTFAALTLTGAGVGLDESLRVWRDGLHPRAATGKLALVEIDARSLARLHHWPWPRSLHAQAITALESAGVQLIGFDVDFSSPSMAAEDGDFARAIDASKVPIALPVFQQNASEAAGNVVENLPLAAFREHAVLASVNVFADPDGAVRSYPYGSRISGLPRPSMAALLANGAGRINSRFPIDGSIDPRTIPRYSFADVIAGQVPARLLRGRSILIGATAVELGDEHLAPGRGVIPGPLVQLLAAETLAQGSAPFDRGPVIPMVLLFGALLAALLARGTVRKVILLAGFAGLFTLPFAAELARLGSFNVVPALAGLLSAALAMAALAALRTLREARLLDVETGLPNSRTLSRVIGSSTEGFVIAVRFINYGEVTGVLGRAAGAELVRRTAERLLVATELPAYRIEENALACLLPSACPDTQLRVTDAVAKVLTAPVEVAGRDITLALGIGVAALVGQGDDEAVTRAAIAADRAAARGAPWLRHTIDLEEQAEWRLAIAAELEKAIAADHIWVAYQPKYDIRAGKVSGVEALVRWRHPIRGPIPPDSFIPALEDLGRISDLTMFVLERALADQKAWCAQGLDVNVAVNISALLATDPAFLLQLTALVGRSPKALRGLTLEVTESAAMTDPDRAIEALENLAALGLRLSIDDYGTGQSTLSYLKRLPASEIKIDKSFVTALEGSPGDQAMVRSTINLAHELGFKVVAEGVETLPTLELLSAFGCDYAQGWHIGKPVPADEFALRWAADKAA